MAILSSVTIHEHWDLELAILTYRIGSWHWPSSVGIFPFPQASHPPRFRFWLKDFSETGQLELDLTIPGHLAPQ